MIDPAVLAASEAALAMVTDGMSLGLGTGRAASAFIQKLGARCAAGLQVHGVATSAVSAELAQSVGVPLVELTDTTTLDLTVDGADEVTPDLDLTKGWGGALVRERIVAAASRRQVIVVGPEKLVAHLGVRGRIPVEIIPFAEGFVTRHVRALGLAPTLRIDPQGRPFETENGNRILDLAPSAPLQDHAAARQCERSLRAIPGVVDTGLFLGTAHEVLVGYPDGHVEHLRRPGA